MVRIRVNETKISNFLSIRNIALENIGPISVFVGPNNFGKSNLVRCFRFYHDLSNSKSPGYEQSVQELKHRRGLNDHLSIMIGYEYVKNQSKYPLKITHSISYDERGKFESEKVQFKRINDPPEAQGDELDVFIQEKTNDNFAALAQNPDTINSFLSGLPYGRTPGLEMVNNPASYRPFNWDLRINNSVVPILKDLRKFIEQWVFIPANRAVGNDTEAEFPKGDGSNTAQFLSKQAQEDRKVVDRLLLLVSRLTGAEDVNFKNINNIMTILATDIPGEKVKLDYYGSGFEQILILLTRMFEEYCNKTVFFIEEPETHLHALLQRKLLYYIIKRTIDNQFFITTHSTIFCRQQPKVLQPYLVKKGGFQTQIKIIGKKEMEEIKSILGHGNADLFGYDAILFVEGQTEEKNLPYLAENNNIDIVAEGIGILNSKGYGNMVQLENILDLLKGTGTDIYAIFDNHQEHQGRLRALRNKLSPDCLVILKRGGFEDCFSDEVLMEAISKLSARFSIEFTEEELNAIKNDLSSRKRNASDVIEKHYFKKTNRSLPKVDFGEALVTAAKEKGEVGNSEPEDLLIRIQKKIHKKLDISK